MSAEQNWTLEVSEADHEANVFRTLGGATWLTEREQRAAFDAIPAVSWDEYTDGPFGWQILRLGEDDFSIVEEKEITAETALALLGATSLEDLRAAADEQDRVGLALAEAFLDQREGTARVR